MLLFTNCLPRLRARALVVADQVFRQPETRTSQADPQPRRQWHKWTNNMFTLSEKERNMMGLEKPLKSQAQEKV